jgi:hypothetical protein
MEDLATTSVSWYSVVFFVLFSFNIFSQLMIHLDLCVVARLSLALPITLFWIKGTQQTAVCFLEIRWLYAVVSCLFDKMLIQLIVLIKSKSMSPNLRKAKVAAHSKRHCISCK